MVLISVIKQWRSAGLNVLDTVKEGAMQRLRTVLMTALLTLVVLPVLYVLWYKDNRIAKAEET